MGPWTFSTEDGAVRHIKIHDIEAIRCIAFLVRDRDWGTLTPLISNEVMIQSEANLRLSYDAEFTTSDARLKVHISLETTEHKFTVRAQGLSEGRFETSRAGFTVLHPITDVAGRPVSVAHSDGTIEHSCFPDEIVPWQPFQDITALTHSVGLTKVACTFQGDTFEMEDQRQWGDASFKTYNRPLAMPWPYIIEDGARIDQSVTLTWEADTTKPATPSEALPESAMPPSTFPEMALVITPNDALRLSNRPDDIGPVNPQRLLCQFDATLGNTEAQFEAFCTAQDVCSGQLFDLEMVCKFDGAPATELEALAIQMKRSGFDPASILICPAVDLQSTPPGSKWPDCPPLEDIHRAAAHAFPDTYRGGGMVSFFPELNRKRPPVEMLSFVSHGLCPIVHAADDLSVMGTLEAIPHITRSARAIIGDLDYRIGPSTIAMRHNPYGNRTLPNPNQQRVAMANDDPRHKAKFGAAYTMGLAAALAPANVAIWTPAALYGPRGIVSERKAWPIVEVLRSLALMARQPVKSSQIGQGLAQLQVADTEFLANLTCEQQGDLGPFEWRVKLP
ncbi:hypothetical protein NBRC116594_11830 [Shimia sp. NS0008-38b]|uniref:hypothetical protein n=1 Tax=Shimia sp. NS0008-38b TaxID=3127653 RepID=UPI0031093B45